MYFYVFVDISEVMSVNFCCVAAVVGRPITIPVRRLTTLSLGRHYSYSSRNCCLWLDYLNAFARPRHGARSIMFSDCPFICACICACPRDRKDVSL